MTPKPTKPKRNLPFELCQGAVILVHGLENLWRQEELLLPRWPVLIWVSRRLGFNSLPFSLTRTSTTNSYSHPLSWLVRLVAKKADKSCRTSFKGGVHPKTLKTQVKIQKPYSLGLGRLTLALHRQLGPKIGFLRSASRSETQTPLNPRPRF